MLRKVDRVALLDESTSFDHEHVTLIAVSLTISARHRRSIRVLVIEGGRLVEEGDPDDLAKRAGSAYARLLEAEAAVSALWSATGWRRLRLDDGSLVEIRVQPGEPMDRASGLAWPVGHLGRAVELLGRASGLGARSGAPLPSPPPRIEANLDTLGSWVGQACRRLD